MQRTGIDKATELVRRDERCRLGSMIAKDVEAYAHGVQVSFNVLIVLLHHVHIHPQLLSEHK